MQDKQSLRKPMPDKALPNRKQKWLGPKHTTFLFKNY
jgi:hypothetical protein